jgi:hypothetical protein
MRPVAVFMLPALVLAAPALAQQGDLALSRVMLSSGGVGYVEYAATVSGAAALRLPVPLEQVDDVLKSLVVFDSQGGVGAVTLPGRDATRAAFGDVPFGPEALEDPLAFLNSLRGVALEVRGARPMTGQVVRAERVPEPVPGSREGGTVERTRVTLLTAEGIRQFVLEDAESVQVADPSLRGRIGRALDALRRDAAFSTRVLTVQAPGGASRTVRVGYVAAAPLWKATYRLVLPEKDGGKARLQGWAVLENATGADWKDVELALQYGNPVTFRQALYRTYFVQRPEVPVEVLGRLLPGVDTRAYTVAADAAPAPVPAPAPMAPAGAARSGVAAESTMRRMAAPPPMAAPAEAASASEGAQETVFVLPGRVSLAAGHTASLPILDRMATAARVGLVQQGRAHPLASVKITNDTGTSLPAGVLTLYDPSSPAMFAGDARLGGLPAGESRLLSFAEDLRTSVAWKQEETTTVAAVTASRGVLRLDERLRLSIQATLTGPVGEARDLLLEIAKRPGFTLVPDAAMVPVEETAGAWRFAVRLAPGETKAVTVRLDQIRRQAVGLLEGDATIARVMGLQGLDANARAALQRLVDLRVATSVREAALEAETRRFEELEADQERVRKNLAAVPPADALHGRLLRQLEALEGQMEQQRRRIDEARAAAEQARRELENAAGRLTL